MEQKEVCEKVVRILTMVLESCQDKLSRTLTNSLPDLSSRMLAKGLISHSVKESGGFDQIMQEFQSGWGFQTVCTIWKSNALSFWILSVT